MRKIYIFVLIVFLLIINVFCLIRCNNSEFKIVRSITITTNGEEKKFSSSSIGDIVFKENYRYIEKNEFDNAPDNRKYYNDEFNTEIVSGISIKNAIRLAKGSTRYEEVEDELKGFYYYSYWYSPGGRIYYTKWEYEKTIFNFVYVKIVNDTTIKIKDMKGETTYTVSSYRIVNF